MEAKELLALHDELERLLQQRGPVQFIRDLSVRGHGAQILAQEARPLGDGRRATRFLYRDIHGGEASFTVIIETDAAGKAQYWLQCDGPRP